MEPWNHSSSLILGRNDSWLLFYIRHHLHRATLPFLPDELTQILESGLPKTLPSPVETGHFKKLPAGDGFVWLAESTATLKRGIN